MGRTRHAWWRDWAHRTHRQVLVLDWRRAEGGWEAQVTWVDEVAGRAVTQWVPAAELTPVETPHPHSGTAYG